MPLFFNNTLLKDSSKYSELLKGRSTCSPVESVGRDYDLQLHIAALFIMLVTSSIAAYCPLYLRRVIERQEEKDEVSEPSDRGFRVHLLKFLTWILWAARHFGTGVIIGTAFIHLLPGARDYLTDPCLPEFFTQTYPCLSEAIAMMACFSIFVVDFLCGSWVDTMKKKTKAVVGQTELHTFESSESLHSETKSFFKQTRQSSRTIVDVHKNTSKGTGAVKRTEGRGALGIDAHRQELLPILIIEAGICFHSIFIGITLALTTGDEFTALLISIVFHQTFEGLAIGGRLASVCQEGLRWKDWKLWICATMYGCTTPMGIAIGIAVRRDYSLASQSSLVLMGIFDSASAGLLLYGGLVGLLSRDFRRKNFDGAPLSVCLIAIACVAAGSAAMGILGRWA